MFQKAVMAALVAAACAGCAADQPKDSVAEQQAGQQVKPVCFSEEPQTGSRMVRKTCS